MVTVYDLTDPLLVQAGKEATQQLRQDAVYYSQSCGKPMEVLLAEERLRPDSLVYPEIPIYDANRTPQFYHLLCANQCAKLPDYHYLCVPEPTYADIGLAYDKGTHEAYYSQHFANFDPTWTDYVYVEYFLGAEEKKSVIERETDLLTPQEILKHKDQVNAAILAELQTWCTYKCFERRSRRTARNIVDCKWVIKWKMELLPDGTTRRIIRARLTIRGFKDRDAQDLIRYAGTSQRYSQRMIVSEAANRGWNIVTTDISKAFLQGVTYKELAELTGEPLRDVNFYLPPSSVAVLKQIDGYTTFDPATEVLHSLKPSTGSVDAPRCFHLKLAQITRSKCKLVPTRTDEELLILHRGGKLVAILTIHVDDLKLAGELVIIKEIIGHLETTFGKLILQWNNFLNCGVRHIQCPKTFTITLDQTDYCKALKTITHPTVKATNKDNIVPSDLFEQFMSLRGAVAYTLLTRTDIAVYVVFLQRQLETTTTYRHIAMLNILVKRLHSSPQVLQYEYLGPTTKFLVITDSAFKKEELIGHSLKGTLLL